MCAGAQREFGAGGGASFNLSAIPDSAAAKIGSGDQIRHQR